MLECVRKRAKAELKKGYDYKREALENFLKNGDQLSLREVCESSYDLKEMVLDELLKMVEVSDMFEKVVIVNKRKREE